jgi:hypothetical protein
MIRSTIEDFREAERELTDQRRTLYKQVLHPFLVSLTAEDSQAEAAQQAMQEAFTSPEYRRAVQDLALFASDEVVRAFGDMSNNQCHAEPDHPMVLWARLLRAIRKSVGNKRTQLTLVEMMRPSIKDVDDPSQPLLQLLKDAE